VIAEKSTPVYLVCIIATSLVCSEPKAVVKKALRWIMSAIVEHFKCYWLCVRRSALTGGLLFSSRVDFTLPCHVTTKIPATHADVTLKPGPHKPAKAVATILLPVSICLLESPSLCSFVLSSRCGRVVWLLSWEWRGRRRAAPHSWVVVCGERHGRPA
jgi:hypothetical protein